MYNDVYNNVYVYICMYIIYIYNKIDHDNYFFPSIKNGLWVFTKIIALYYI